MQLMYLWYTSIMTLTISLPLLFFVVLAL